MYFGDFLIKNKSITPDELVQALCYQVESMPSLFRIIYESKYVSANEILNILKSHIKQDVDVVAVLLSEKKITQDQVNALNLKHLSLKVPLGESLVRLNIIKENQLNDLLSLHYAEKSNKDSGGSLRENEVGEVSDAALESLRELGIDITQFETTSKPVNNLATKLISDKEIPKRLEVEYFLKAFNEKQKNKILKLISFLEENQNNSNELSNYFNSLFRDVHMLKGAASFSEIIIFESILIDLDAVLDFALASGEEGVALWCKSHLNFFKLFINEFWGIRQEIEELQSDLGLTETHEGIVKCRELVYLMKLK